MTGPQQSFESKIDMLPVIKLDRGIHVMHLFYRIDRPRWAQLEPGQSAAALSRLDKLALENSASSHPHLRTFANVGGKADLGFFLLRADLSRLTQLHRAVVT